MAPDTKAERVLYEACAELKKIGFRQVRVLRGGLMAWLTYAQPIIGRPPGEDTLAQLSPAELWAESQFGANQFNHQKVVLCLLNGFAGLNRPAVFVINPRR